MATQYIQQEYNLNEPFNVYNLSDLTGYSDSSLATQWKDPWSDNMVSVDLVGFRQADGKFIELGSEQIYDTQNTEVSGVWQLCKTGKVNLNCLGESGQVSVQLTMQNTRPPLANHYRPWLSTVVLTSTSEIKVYGNTNISVDIIPADGTTVKNLWYCKTYATPSPKLAQRDSQLTCSGVGVNYNQDITNGLWHNLYLSVDYVASGILEYIPNYDYVNPSEDPKQDLTI